MKKILLILLSALMLMTGVAVAGCGESGSEQHELNQWDYIDPNLRYTLYEYLDDAPSDLSRNPITNSFGEVQSHCWNFVGNFGNVNIKDWLRNSDPDFYYILRISQKATTNSVVMTKLSMMICAEAACEMNFSLSVTGDNTPRASVTVYAVANTEVELVFEHFAEYTLGNKSAGEIIIRLENPDAIGNIKYGFSSLELSLRK